MKLKIRMQQQQFLSPEWTRLRTAQKTYRGGKWHTGIQWTVHAACSANKPSYMQYSNAHLKPPQAPSRTDQQEQGGDHTGTETEHEGTDEQKTSSPERRRKHQLWVHLPKTASPAGTSDNSDSSRPCSSASSATKSLQHLAEVTTLTAVYPLAKWG